MNERFIHLPDKIKRAESALIIFLNLHISVNQVIHAYLFGILQGYVMLLERIVPHIHGPPGQLLHDQRCGKLLVCLLYTSRCV